MRRSLLVLATLLAWAPPASLAAQALRVDSVYLRPIQKGDNAWYATQLTNYVRAVSLVGVRDATACERRQVEFSYLSNAPVNNAAPSLVTRGQWNAPAGDLKTLLDEDKIDSSATERCIALAPWRLGDSPGRQYLRARLVRDTIQVLDDAADSTYALFTATAHAPPAIVAGVAVLNQPLPRDDAEEGEEETRATPIVGFDLPLVWSALGGDAQDVAGHFRLLVATTYENPGDDLFLGLELQPILAGPRGAFNPLQFTAGYGFQRGPDGPFFAIHYNTTAIIQAFLGLF